MKVDSPGVAPGLPVCRTGVLLLDHEPVHCASRCSSSVVSGSRGTRTHKRLSAATCFRDRLLIRPDDFQKSRDEGQESRAREETHVFMLLSLDSSLSSHLRGQDSNLRTRDSKSRISTGRNYPAMKVGSGWWAVDSPRRSPFALCCLATHHPLSTAHSTRVPCGS